MEARSVIEVDLGAIAHNVSVLKAQAPDALLCVVVKADGYGHGAAPVGQAALAAGADWLAVSQIAEARVLRRTGLTEPILLLSEPTPAELAESLELGCRMTVYRAQTIDQIDEFVREHGLPAAKLHLKVDTGMQRVGCAPTAALELATRIAEARSVEFEGLATHLAVADEADHPATTRQLAALDAAEAEIRDAGLTPALVHAANSAALIRLPAARRDLVRSGIAVYGVAPGPGIGDDLDLRPAMSYRTQVTFVKQVEAGSEVSYGLRHTFDRATTVATIPVGYADGVPRALGVAGAEVLIGGRRRPMVGVVTMDQVVVDLGDDDSVQVGDEVVLIGRQADEQVTAEEWASLTGTIGYEIVCNAGRRAERRWIEP
jgi:alanine racemase